MQTLRSRLILSHILPLVVIIPLASLALSYLLETQIVLSELSEKLNERANLIAEVLYSRPEVWSNPNHADLFMSNIAYQNKGQIFLLQPNGYIIASNKPAIWAGGSKPEHLRGIETATSGGQSMIISYGWLESGVEVLVPVMDAEQELIGIVAVYESLEGITSYIGKLRSIIVIALCIEVVLGCLIGYILATRLERPIGRAAKGVIDISEGREIDPVPIEGPREIRQLSIAVNTLEERLRLLEETRRHSLANIVHELGRPLGAIQSAIHVLLKGSNDPEVEHELLVGVDNEIKRMGPLLDDLAMLHGQVTGTIVLNQDEISLSAWLPPTLLQWKVTIQDKGITWQTSIPTDLPTVYIDSEKMTQVIGNLLSNAVKYTPKGGSISVSAGRNAGESWIQIRDTGIGIIQEEQDRIFEPFYRSKQTKRFPQGLGLGLTIARDIVEAHGGWIELESQPGVGSLFSVHLPICSNQIH